MQLNRRNIPILTQHGNPLELSFLLIAISPQITRSIDLLSLPGRTTYEVSISQTTLNIHLLWYYLLQINHTR